MTWSKETIKLMSFILLACESYAFEQCGVAEIGSFYHSSSEQIISGKDVDPNRHPWMVSIGTLTLDENYNEVWQHFCGGTIVGRNSILTAAHCTEMEEMSIRFGDSDLSEIKISRIQSIYRSYIRRHPKYNGLSAYYDVALLYVEEPFVYNKFIKPICLPSEASERQDEYTGNFVTVLGWGKTSNDSAPKNLKSVELQIFPQKYCNDTHSLGSIQTSRDLNDVGKSIDQKFQSQIMCIGKVNYGAGTCNGDSGGPVVQTDFTTFPPHLVQIGVIHGKVGDCNNDRHPGIQARLRDPNIFKFITETLGLHRAWTDEALPFRTRGKMLDEREAELISMEEQLRREQSGFSEAWTSCNAQEFLDNPKLALVMGGYPGQKSIEIVSTVPGSDLIQRCQIPPDFKSPVQGTVGAVIDGKLRIIADGKHYNRQFSYSLTNNSWYQKPMTCRKGDFTLPEVVWEWGKTVMLNPRKWWLTIEGSRNTLIFESNQFSPGPQLPHAVSSACLIKINATHIFLIGGHIRRRRKDIEISTVLPEPSGKTYSFNQFTGEWRAMNSMSTPRFGHACGRVGRKIFVTGGITTPLKTYIDTTEVFDLETNEWSLGPRAPRKLYGAQTLPLEDTFLVLGGLDVKLEYGDIKDIYHVDKNTLQMKKMPNEMKNPRYGHTVIPIDPKILGC